AKYRKRQKNRTQKLTHNAYSPQVIHSLLTVRGRCRCTFACNRATFTWPALLPSNYAGAPVSQCGCGGDRDGCRSLSGRCADEKGRAVANPRRSWGEGERRPGVCGRSGELALL